MVEFDKAGLIYYRTTGMPMKHYIDEMPGVPLKPSGMILPRSFRVAMNGSAKTVAVIRANRQIQQQSGQYRA
jgi:hypothetical protein